MIIKHEFELKDFKFWGGAKAHRECLSDTEMNKLEALIDEMYPNGIDETTLNDIFWFDQNLIAEFLGYEDFDNDIWDRRH